MEADGNEEQRETMPTNNVSDNFSPTAPPNSAGNSYLSGLPPLVLDWIDETAELVVALAELDVTFEEHHRLAKEQEQSHRYFKCSREAAKQDNEESGIFEEGEGDSTEIEDEDDKAAEGDAEGGEEEDEEEGEEGEGEEASPQPTWRPNPPPREPFHAWLRREASAKKCTVGMIWLVSCWFFINTLSEIYTELVAYNSRPILAAAVPPRPFFPESQTFVWDYYTGDVPEVHPDDALTITFFYAPWNYHCRRFRPHYEKTARAFDDFIPSIRFNAINCFTEDSECRERYKLSAMPIVVAYRGHPHSAHVYAYHGEMTADHLYLWIQDLLSPVELIRDEDELRIATLKYRVLALGYFPFRALDSLPIGYGDFLATSLSLAKGIPDDKYFRFATFTNRTLAQRMRIHLDGTIVVISSRGKNDRFYQPVSKDFLMLSVAKNRFLSSIKSIRTDFNFQVKERSFEELYKDTPLLLLASQHYPMYQPVNHYRPLFDQVELEYKRCPANKPLSSPEMEKEFDEDYQARRAEDAHRDSTQCRKMRKFKDVEKCCGHVFSLIDHSKQCTLSRAPQFQAQWDREKCAKYSNFTARSGCTHRQKSFFGVHEYLSTSTRQCNLMSKLLGPEDFFKMCCDEYFFYNVKAVDHAQLLVHIDSVDNDYSRTVEGCQRYRLSRDVPGPSYTKQYKNRPKDSDFPTASVGGYGCNPGSFANVTAKLRFGHLDLRHQEYFYDKLGLSTELPPQVILVDKRDEKIYRMEDAFSKDAIRDFIRDYHKGRLQEKPNEEADSDNFFLDPSDDIVGFRKRTKSPLTRLARTQFLEIVGEKYPMEDSFIVLTGGIDHAASGTVLHFVHEAAHLFLEQKAPIAFYSVDADLNHLPREYRREKFPRILLLQRDGVDRFFYPNDVPMTTNSVISFILQHGSFGVRKAFRDRPAPLKKKRRKAEVLVPGWAPRGTPGNPIVNCVDDDSPDEKHQQKRSEAEGALRGAKQLRKERTRSPPSPPPVTVSSFRAPAEAQQ